MAYAVELFFDAATEAALGRLSAGKNETSRPHISLGGSRDIKDRDNLVLLLETLAREQAGVLPVTLSYLGFFPGEEGVVFYGVTVTTPLLLLHRRFHTSFTALVRDWSPFYEPGRWVPHCTLAYGVSKEQLPATILALQAQVTSELSGLLTSIALVEIPSGEEQAIFAFETSGMPE
jgi:2'-5' RNA ligase